MHRCWLRAGIALAVCATALAAAPGAGALQTPGRTAVRADQVRLVALNHEWHAFEVSRSATLDTHGLAWGEGNPANYACAVCIGS